jgi:uncharacterized peroxidase-related enzyme
VSGSFLKEAAMTARAQELYDIDISSDGFVWNVSRLWANQPESMDHLFELMSEAFKPSELSFRDRGILVLATASTRGDSYCSLAWGGKLARASDANLSRAVLTGSDEGLNEQEAALASWARKIVRDPNATTPSDIQGLREVGFSDAQIFAITFIVALRLAFSTVNDALGAHPDAQLAASLPSEVVSAVSFGREPRD